jgi:hypothetical protein
VDNFPASRRTFIKWLALALLAIRFQRSAELTGAGRNFLSMLPGHGFIRCATHSSSVIRLRLWKAPSVANDVTPSTRVTANRLVMCRAA